MRIRALGPISAALAVALLLPVGSAGAVTETNDTVGVVKEEVAPTNAEIAVRLSEATPLPDTSTVVVSRDDRFADALSSGVLQDEWPLLLVPSTGPLPDRVVGELARLAPERILILGGDQAVAPEVEAQFTGLGFTTERRAGDSRFETATAIAAMDASGSDTAIIARAFPGAGSTDDTQAFADTLGVGALSAERGWPILLTQTELLSGPTEEYLRATPDISSVKIIGGTAAISEQVEDDLIALGLDVERIAGEDRFSTAVEVAKERGADSAADVARITLVDSQFANSWAGGLAAAAHSAHFEAPILLTSGSIVPPATDAFLAPGLGGDDPAPLTCVAFPTACENVRVDIGLPPAAGVVSDTPNGAVVTPGQSVTLQIDSQGRPVSDVEASGTCLDAPQQFGTQNPVTVLLAGSLSAGSCAVELAFTITGEQVFAQATPPLRQTETFTYTSVPQAGPGLSVVESGGSLDARQVASNLVGAGVQVFGVSLTGSPEAIGLFTGGADIVGFEQGIVMSTGRVSEIPGPNSDSGTSGFNGQPGDPDMTLLSGNETFDAAALEFDFVAAPDATVVSFDYVFGSEEYEKFVGSSFNDVFAFYVNGHNCALIEGQPVAVNSVNSQTNAGFYRPNAPDGVGNSPIDIELDGLTLMLPCQAPIIPGGANRLKLVIADASDSIFDSAVLIRAASFTVS